MNTPTFLYKNKNIAALIEHHWDEEIADFQKKFSIDLELFDHNNRDELARFLNQGFLAGWKDHMFYTLVNLKYHSI